MTIWSLARRNLLRNCRRSILTGLTVVVGFSAFALAGGFMAQSLDGLREGTIRNGLGHLQFGDPAAFDSTSGTTLEHGLVDAEEIERILRADTAVLEVLPRIDFVGLIASGTRSVPFVGTGLDPAPELRTMDNASALSAGRWLENRDVRAVVLGGGLAAALQVGVGDTVTILATTADGTLNAVDASVSGLADIPIKELDDRFVATTLGLAADLLMAQDRVSKIVVVLRETSESDAALQRLSARLTATGRSVVGRTWEELGLFYRQVRRLYIGIFGFMGAVLVVVVLLATTNSMMMAATERVREIGTLRALGTRPMVIQRMFAAEALLLAGAACCIGALLSLAIRSVLNHSGIILPPPPGVTHGVPLYIKLYGTAYGVAAVAMTLTVVLAAAAPARRAVRTPIVEALSHV